MKTTPKSGRRLLRSTAVAVALAIGAAACGTAAATSTQEATSVSDSPSSDFFDSGVVHDIDVDFDSDALNEIIASYITTGEKDWMEVTITIDGTTFQNVGMRLKGNSSLFSVTTASAENPEDLPWLIRFDKYVDGQSYQGYNDIVIRSNSTETSMNEAVAAELLEAAGLASQQAVATTLSFNGGDTELRLAMQNPTKSGKKPTSIPRNRPCTKLTALVTTAIEVTTPRRTTRSSIRKLAKTTSNR